MSFMKTYDKMNDKEKLFFQILKTLVKCCSNTSKYVR